MVGDVVVFRLFVPLFCIRGIIKLFPSHLSLDNDLVGGLLLLRLAKDVYGPPGLVGSVWDVEAARLVLADLLDLLEVVVGKFDLLEVVTNAAGGNGLGDLLDGLVGDEQRLTDHVVTESRVLGNVNTLLTHPLDEVGLEKARVALDLVGGRCDTSLVDQSLEVLLCVVGNTNSAGLLLVELGHGLPCVDNGDGVEHLDVTVVAEGEEVLVNITLLVESNGEVDKVKVEVVEAKLSKAVVEGRGDIVGPVLRVPELGCDEEVLTLDTLAECPLEGLSDLLLVAIDLGKINVLVASLESLVNGGLDLTGLGLPCSKTQLAMVLLVSGGRLLFTRVLTGWRRRC
jgi:hypothetical protein